MMAGGGLLVAALAAGSAIVAVKMFGGAPSANQGTGASADHGEGEAAAKAGKPIYFALEPAFTVNLADEGATRYLQAEVQVMARNQEAIDAVTLHMPVIRNQLLLLLSQNKVADLKSLEDREKLREKALEEVRKILKKETGKAGVEALYFTSFVTQ